MYIWILLATIMVTFAFYNVAPRADKEHALNEIKAATVVNRFKAEHSARLHTMECEILYNKNNGDWNGTGGFGEDGLVIPSKSSQGPVDVTNIDLSTDYGLEAGELFKQNLPVGYYLSDSSHASGNYKGGKTIHHYIYCLKDFIYKPGKSDDGTAIETQGFADCHADNVEDIGRKRYFVSYMQIPDRWVSKDGTNTPLPMFVNLLAKASDSNVSFGWVEYACPKGTGVDDCISGDKGHFTLHGIGNSVSTSIKYDSEKDKTFETNRAVTDGEGNALTDDNDNPIYTTYNDIAQERQRLEKEAGNNNYVRYVSQDTAIPGTSPLWSNSDIKDNCIANPCIVAYEVMPIIDAACHCYNILNKASGGEMLSVAECFNEAYSAKKSHNDKTVIKEKEYKKTYTHGSAEDGVLKGDVFADESYKDDAEKWEHIRCNLLPKPSNCSE